MLKKLFSFGKQKEGETGEITLEDTVDINYPLLNTLAPDSIQEKEGQLQSGDNYTKTFVVTSLKGQIDANDLRQLNEISDNIDFSYYYEEMDEYQIKKQLSKSIQENKTKRDNPNAKPSTKTDAEAEIKSAENTLEKLSFKQTKMFNLQTIIKITAHSERELDVLTNKATTIFSSIGRPINPRFRVKDAFDSSLPFATNKLKNFSSTTITSRTLSYFFPFHENEIIMADGIILGKNRATGNIIKVNSENLLNKHMFVVGISGSGKSTFLFADMMRRKSFGYDILVIDPKGEFGRPFIERGGKWFKFSNEKGGNMLNMFDVPQVSYKVDESGEYQERINPIRDHITSLMVSFKLMYPNIDLDAQNELSSVLIELYKDHNLDIDEDVDFTNISNEDYPILQDLANLIDSYKKEKLENGNSNPKYNPERFERLANFRKGIDKYIEGGLYQHVLNGYTNVDTTDKSLIAFDVSAVTDIEELNKVVYYNVLTYIKKLILNGERNKTQVYVDEAHYIADPDVPIAMKNLFIMMKVFRSLNCGVTPATQSISDFLSAEEKGRNYGEAVIDQSIQRIFLPMLEKEVEEVNDKLNLKLTEENKEFLKVASGDVVEDRGKGFLYVGSKKVKIEVILTELEHKVWAEKNYEDLE
ncbi:VirB4 family type IV secretion system protein [Staphylococcus succinus]|uniref:VirB4 family type IV secretion system protein n=1 Tax=Staphylococcus TaxID=1279 RepID=UPI003F54A204